MYIYKSKKQKTLTEQPNASESRHRRKKRRQFAANRYWGFIVMGVSDILRCNERLFT